MNAGYVLPADYNRLSSPLCCPLYGDSYGLTDQLCQVNLSLATLYLLSVVR